MERAVGIHCLVDRGYIILVLSPALVLLCFINIKIKFHKCHSTISGGPDFEVGEEVSSEPFQMMKDLYVEYIKNSISES